MTKRFSQLINQLTRVIMDGSTVIIDHLVTCNKNLGWKVLVTPRISDHYNIEIYINIK